MSSDVQFIVEARELRRRHLERFKPRKAQLQGRIDRAYASELDRLARQFAASGLEAQAAPLAAPLKDYLYWLRWCSWCCLHLAPCLELESDRDIDRIVSGLMIYAGPRIIDDAIDEHVHYKNIRPTLYGELGRLCPHVPAGTLRSQLVLLGVWVVFYGGERLRRHAGPELADRTLLLLRRIVPGAVLESLHRPPLAREEYHALVRCKATYYDSILYSVLLDPVDPTLRTALLGITSDISALAQFLNDLGDGPEDLARGQENAGRWFPGAHNLLRECHAQAGRIWQAIVEQPADCRDALAAILCETLDSAKGGGFDLLR